MNIETLTQLKQYFSKKGDYIKKVYDDFQSVRNEVINVHETRLFIVLPKSYYLQQAQDSNTPLTTIERIKVSEELARFDEKVKEKIKQLDFSLIHNTKIYSTAPSSSTKTNNNKNELGVSKEFFLKDTLPITLPPLIKREVSSEDVQIISDKVLSSFAKGLCKNNLNVFLQLAIMNEWYIQHYGFVEISSDTELLLLEQLNELNAAVSHLPPFDIYEFLILFHSRIQVFSSSLKQMVENFEEIHRYNDKLIKLSQHALYKQQAQTVLSTKSD